MLGLCHFLALALSNPIFIGAVDAEPIIADTTTVLHPQRVEQSSRSLLLSGNVRGVKSEKYAYPSVRWIADVVNEDSIEISSDNSTLVQGGWTILAEKNLENILWMLKDGLVPTCEKGAVKSGHFSNRERFVFQSKVPEPMIGLSNPNASPMDVQTWKCTVEFPNVSPRTHSSTDFEFELLNFDVQTHNDSPIWALNLFEFRPAVHLNLHGERIDVVGRPIQELSRTLDYIQSSNAMYMDAGNFVDRFTSVYETGLSAHRFYEYAWLEGVEPVALGIGKNELIMGVKNFLTEIEGMKLPYIASNLQPPKDLENPFPEYRIVTTQENGQDVSMLVMSILDPALQNEIPAIELDGWMIQDPNEALFKIVRHLHSAGIEPDAILLLTTASSDVLRKIRISGPPIDLMLGDSSLATHRLENDIVSFRHIGEYEKGAPYTLPMDGLQSIDLTFGSEGLSQLNLKVKNIYEDATANAAISGQLTINRAPHYVNQNIPVLTLSNKSWYEPMTQGEWEQLLCETILHKTQADTVLLDNFVPPTGFGTLTKKQIADALDVNDIVEVHRIPGSKYATFLAQTERLTSTSCGVLPGSKSPKPRGLAIENDMVYYVTTTDQVRLSKGLDVILKSNQTRKWLDTPNVQTIMGPDGRPINLRTMILNSFQDDTVIEYASRVSLPLERKNKWVLRFKDVGFTTENFQTKPQEALSTVPETMINNPSAASRGSTVDVTLDWIAPKSKTTFRGLSNYSALYLPTEESGPMEKKEVGDDVKLTTTWSYTASDWNIKSLSWMPFSEILYDSEWTPIELEDGSLSTLQKDLSLTVGLSLKPIKTMKTLKVGAFVNRDLANLESKPNEWASSLQFATSRNLNQALILSHEGTLYWYGDTLDDDASDLRYRLYGKSKATLPFSSNVGVSLYATGLAVKGRSSDNQVWGYGWNMGASIDVLGTFLLNH